jgi:hypothetical protein
MGNNTTVIGSTAPSLVILSNSIYENVGLGIDLSGDGVTQNDTCDPDSGPNTLQNYPILRRVVNSGSSIRIVGVFNSSKPLPGLTERNYTIQFFANDKEDPSKHGEGQRFIGQRQVTITDDTTNPNNCTIPIDFTFNLSTPIPTNATISMTATDLSGSSRFTSEFSGPEEPPTAVKMLDYKAERLDNAVRLSWNTSFEIDNLGFNIYRDLNGKREQINPSLIAGSALVAGQGNPFTAGQSYQWFDQLTSNAAFATYWIEDIDLNGTRTLHGPVNALPTTSSTSFRALEQQTRPSALLSNLASQQLSADSTLTLKPTVIKKSKAGRTSKGISTQSASDISTLQQELASSDKVVKLSVRETALYQIGRAELIAAGLDASATGSSLQLFVDGREQPIQVIGDNGLSFDSIKFYGETNDSSYIKERVYFLRSAAGTIGKRMPTVPALEGMTPTADTFLSTVQKADKRIFYPSLKNGEADNFFGAVVSIAGVDQPITVKNLSPKAVSGTAQVEFALQGVSNQAHNVQIQLNGNLIGQMQYYGLQLSRQSFEVPTSQLREGINQIRMVSQQGQSDVSLVSSIKLTYLREMIADQDQLTVLASGGSVINVTGFSNTEITAYDVTTPEEAIEIKGEVKATEGGGYAITVAVPAIGESNRIIEVVSNNQLRRVSKAEGNTASRLRQAENGAALLIIGAENILPSMKALAQYRESQGLRTALVDVKDIYDEFGYGQKSPEAIREFVWYAAKSWQEKPRFVLLAGDASYDARNNLGFGDWDLVPSKQIETASLETASDQWYVKKDQEQLSIAIGRFPARNQAEADLMVNKTIKYESIGQQQQQQAPTMLLVADKGFVQSNEEIKAVIAKKYQYAEVSLDKETEESAKARIDGEIRKGYTIVNYSGHGSRTAWSVKNLWTASQAEKLTDQDRLSGYVLMTCWNGYFGGANELNMGESLMKAQGGGAWVLASTGMTLAAGQRELNKGLYSQVRGRVGGREQLRVGEAIMRAKQSALVDEDVRNTFVLLGDPSMIMR